MKLHANARTCFHCRSLIVSHVIDDHQRPRAAAAEFRVSPRTVHKWVRRFRAYGVDGLHDRSSRPHRIARQHLQPGKELHDAVFSLLHSPPRDSGFNRTTWRLSDLRNVLIAKGVVATQNSISAAIKQAGYRWKQARVVLTSSDPLYREKIDAIRSVLSGLGDDEAFFSIDEFGPFSVTMRGGKSLQAPGQFRTIPQWQSSKGHLIVTAALELSQNQLIHFFSESKNTDEIVKLVELIRRRYRGYGRVYLSWDAVSWHRSKKLLDKIEFLNEWAVHDGAPEFLILPLPTGAQFLNVIESVFSGMARAILHNSDYGSVSEAKTAISRYFDDRNSSYRKTPRRAGKSIWKTERGTSAFLESNNCKDPRYGSWR
jgi:transposase